MSDTGNTTGPGPTGNQPPPLPDTERMVPPQPVAVDPVVIKAQADSLDEQIAKVEAELQVLSEQRREALAQAQDAATRLDELLQRRAALQRALDWPERPQQLM